MASTLTHDDVARLMAEPSPETRAEVAAKLAAEIDSPQLTESELNLAQDIVRLMAKDVEVAVRKSLSESLRKATRLPHDVAMRLASDVEEVALPVLTESPVLTDKDLVTVVQAGSPGKQEAIAARPNVSEQVSAVLVAQGGEQAVAKLMSNASARISDTSFTKAVDRFPESKSVQENMVKRPALPVVVAERLVTVVSEQLKDYLVSHHELSPAVAADLVLQSRERNIISLSSGSTEQDVEKLVAQMHANKRLTPSIVLRALCMGDMPFFEAAMAVLAGIPVTNARILIHDGGALGLKSLYQKSGMPPRLMPAVRVAIDVVNETPMDGGENDRERMRARVIERILTQYEDLRAEDVDYLLNKLGDVLTTAA